MVNPPPRRAAILSHRTTLGDEVSGLLLPVTPPSGDDRSLRGAEPTRAGRAARSRYARSQSCGGVPRYALAFTCREISIAQMLSDWETEEPGERRPRRLRRRGRDRPEGTNAASAGYRSTVFTLRTPHSRRSISACTMSTRSDEEPLRESSERRITCSSSTEALASVSAQKLILVVTATSPLCHVVCISRMSLVHGPQPISRDRKRNYSPLRPRCRQGQDPPAGLVDSLGRVLATRKSSSHTLRRWLLSEPPDATHHTAPGVPGPGRSVPGGTIRRPTVRGRGAGGADDAPRRQGGTAPPPPSDSRNRPLEPAGLDAETRELG